MRIKNILQRDKPPPKEQDSSFQKPSLFRDWIRPIGVIGGLALSSYLSLRLIDFFADDSRGLLDVVFLTHAQDVTSAVGSIPEVLVGLVGLVITVVAIVVQLAAQRYTPKLVEMFIADRINILFFVMMVWASIYSLWFNYSTTTDFLPFWGALFLMALTTLILSSLAPYFGYVFRFLTPGNIIKIIRDNATNGMAKVWKTNPNMAEIRRLQEDVANSMEQISDISLSAVTQMDRNVALLSIRSLKDVMVDHLLTKRRMPKAWFVPQKDHFTSISTDFLKEIYISKTWVEVKGFLDMDLIFKMAIKEMPDAVSAIANNTKIVGLYAMKLGDTLVLNDVIQFFNTFLRHAINDRNPKAIYNLFYQYRLLAEEVMKVDPALTEKIAFYFKYYGQIAQQYNIPLILITASFDLAHLLQKAYDLKLPNTNTLLRILLEVDDNPATRSNEFDLRSVRKAQLNFASFLLSRGDHSLARRVFEDLRQESRERMDSIRGEMMAVKERKFWEVTDRGVDFFFIDEEQKRFLNEFFVQYMEPYYAIQERQPQVQSA